eukprot:TRINITY_DN8543_c1_g1_i2.p1 TRINITY_DN8543_c1_g1~~TRINITY_DN8543_c1_g1_i2.p1  ORF type:complete len:355 (+),score=69.54 TRINITY_DN8543_c1_g1_i2:77-1066(+)
MSAASQRRARRQAPAQTVCGIPPLTPTTPSQPEFNLIGRVVCPAVSCAGHGARDGYSAAAAVIHDGEQRLAERLEGQRRFEKETRARAAARIRELQRQRSDETEAKRSRELALQRRRAMCEAAYIVKPRKAPSGNDSWMPAVQFSDSDSQSSSRKRYSVSVSMPQQQQCEEDAAEGSLLRYARSVCGGTSAPFVELCGSDSSLRASGPVADQIQRVPPPDADADDAGSLSSVGESASPQSQGDEDDCVSSRKRTETEHARYVTALREQLLQRLKDRRIELPALCPCDAPPLNGFDPAVHCDNCPFRLSRSGAADYCALLHCVTMHLAVA